MRKVTKNAVVTFLAYWNEVKPEDERVKNIESLTKFRRRLFKGKAKYITKHLM